MVCPLTIKAGSPYPPWRKRTLTSLVSSAIFRIPTHQKHVSKTTGLRKRSPPEKVKPTRSGPAVWVLDNARFQNKILPTVEGEGRRGGSSSRHIERLRERHLHAPRRRKTLTFIACGPLSGQVHIITKIERLEMKYTFHDPKFFSVQTRFEVGELAKPATYNISVWQNRKIFRWSRITLHSGANDENHAKAKYFESSGTPSASH